MIENAFVGETTAKTAQIDCNSDVAAGYRVVVVDDNFLDFTTLRSLLTRFDRGFESICHYSSLDAFFADADASPHVVVLDRNLRDTTLTEARIPEIRAAHRGCGVIMYTGCLTPSLRSTAAHEGAVAVVEKGSLTGDALAMLVEATAVLGPQMSVGRREH